MKEEEKRKELQQKYLELQLLDQQMKQVQKQVQAIESQIAEVTFVEQSLEELKNVEVNSEIFVPISAGIFAKAELKDNKELLVNVGGNTTVAKSIPDTKKMLAEQITEMRKVQEELALQFERITAQAEKISLELQKQISGE